MITYKPEIKIVANPGLAHCAFRTQKFKAQPTNSFFATVNQMPRGAFQLPTTAEHCFVVGSVLNDLINARSACSNRKLRGAAEHLIDRSEKRISRLSFEI